MDGSLILAKKKINIYMPYQELFTDQESLDLYQDLIYSIFKDWSEGQDLYLHERGVLWRNLFIKINQFILDPEKDLINFPRCLSAGSLIFTLNGNRLYIYSNPLCMQALFQLLSRCPSTQIICKKFGNIPKIRADQIHLLSQFHLFLNDLLQKFPQSNCHLGWTLYEMKYTFDDIIFANSGFATDAIDSNKEVLDSIIDDSDDSFYHLVIESSDKEHEVNKQFCLLDYKLPSILSDFPTYSCLCCFFDAEKCLFTLCEFIEGGLNSEEIKKVDGNGRSPIHFASSGGNISIIQKLLESGYNVNLADNDKLTPLHYSAMAGMLSAFQFLYFNGASRLLLNPEIRTSIFNMTCYFGNLNIIKFINSKILIDEFIKYEFSDDKKNCLFISCMNGNDQIVKYILEYVNHFKNEIKNIDKILFESLLCSCKNGSLACMKLIFDFSTNFEKANNFQKKLILLYKTAASNKNDDIIDFLNRHFKNKYMQKEELSANPDNYLILPQIKDYFTEQLRNIPIANINRIFYNYAISFESFIENFELQVSQCNDINQIDFDLQKFIVFENFYDIWKSHFSDDAILNQIINSLFHILQISINQMKIILIKANNDIDQLKSDTSDAQINDKMKLMRQKKETKSLKMQCNNLRKLNNIYQAKIRDIQNQLNATKHLLKEIFNKDQDELNLIDEVDQLKEAGPPILSEVLLNELIDHMNLKPHARRYSKLIKNVAFIIFSYSPAAYRKLAEFFPFPNERTIRDSFKHEIKTTKENLLNLSQLEIILNKLHKIYTDNDNEQINASLAVDAATMNPRRTGKSGFVAYQLQPFKKNQKTAIVHVDLNKNSRFDSKTIDVAHEIAEVGQKANFNIQILATDADSKTNKIHREFFNYLHSTNGSFEDKLEKMKNYEKEFPDSDLLHLLKAMRRNFNNNFIKMTESCRLISRDNEIEVLRTSEYFLDDVKKNTPLSQMRDDLALYLYNTFNLHLLGENSHFQFYSFQFILVLLLTSIQSNNLSVKARIDLCKTDYYTMMLFKRKSEQWQRMKINEQNVVKFFDNNNFHRIVNNLFCYSFVFKNYSDQISTENHTSHPLELRFGDIRQGSRGDDSSDKALFFISKSIIREELLTNLGKKTSPVRGRCSISGSTESDNWKLNIPPSIQIDKIPNEMFQICNDQLTQEQFCKTNAWALTCFLKNNTPTIIPKLSGLNSGSRIQSRLHNLEGKF